MEKRDQDHPCRDFAVPNIAIAAVIFILFLILASAAKSVVRHISQRRQRRQSLGLLLGQLVHMVAAGLGFLIALSTVAPSFRAGDLVRMLGIGSVAIGFAFQNILQNFLAGILLLLQEPFKLGGWITITGVEGKVQDIQTRATVIQTAEGDRIVIPNAVLFTYPVVVAHPAPPQKEESIPTHALTAHTGQPVGPGFRR
jgi:small-conductance mechanosensitive channel